MFTNENEHYIANYGQFCR